MAFNLICKHCGKPFLGKLICQKFCSIDCCNAAKRGQKATQNARTARPHTSHADAEFRRMKRDERTEEEKRRARIEARDAAFAAWERENGVADSVVESEGVRTVWRGQRCIGGLAANHIKHNA